MHLGKKSGKNVRIKSFLGLGEFGVEKTTHIKKRKFGLRGKNLVYYLVLSMSAIAAFSYYFTLNLRESVYAEKKMALKNSVDVVLNQKKHGYDLQCPEDKDVLT